MAGGRVRGKWRALCLSPDRSDPVEGPPEMQEGGP